MMQPERAINPVPVVVLILAAIVMGVELFLTAAESGLVGPPTAIGWRLMAVQDYAFSPVVSERVFLRQDYGFDLLKRFVTYPFIGQEIIGAAFGAALILALGKFVADAFGAVAFVIIFFATSIAGALIFGVFVSGAIPLFGPFVPTYGIIGAYTYAIWLRLGQAGENQLLAFRLIGVLLLIQLLFGLIFGSSLMWIAELGGFFAGFTLSILVAPGGWTTFLNRMRQRT